MTRITPVAAWRKHTQGGPKKPLPNYQQIVSSLPMRLTFSSI